MPLCGSMSYLGLSATFLSPGDAGAPEGSPIHTAAPRAGEQQTPCLLLHSAFLAGGGSWSAALVMQAGGQTHVQDAGGKTVVQADSAKSVSVCVKPLQPRCARATIIWRSHTTAS